jgi:hypothetical protein
MLNHSCGAWRISPALSYELAVIMHCAHVALTEHTRTLVHCAHTHGTLCAHARHSLHRPTWHTNCKPGGMRMFSSATNRLLSLINSDTAACKGATVPVVHTCTPNLCARMQVAPGVANLVGGAVFPAGANLYTGKVAPCSHACRTRNGMQRLHSTCARALTSMCDTSQPQLARVHSW